MTMILILFLLVIAGGIVFILFQVSITAKAKITADALDLESVRNSLVEKFGWSQDRAEAARVEYVRFLTLLQRRPSFMLVPWPNAEGQDDLDQFWHQHILDTAKYAEDCNRLFGRMIHHNPHVVRGSGQEADAMEKTQRLYARTFGSGTYGRPVDARFLTDDGAAAVLILDGAGDGDGGHGHGEGGHSCGGHSCGHSCGGHGCGGH